MEYVFFDTSSWLEILRADEFNEQLGILETLVSTKTISLVTHDQVIFEWNKNKEKRISSLVDSVRNYVYSANKFLKENNLRAFSITNASLNSKQNQINEQIKRTEELLFNNSIKLTTSNEVKLLAADLASKNEEPFFCKKNSMNDALLFFSLIDWAKKNDLTTITFVSNNTKDFSDQQDKSKLHVRLLESAGELRVDYYIDGNNAVNELATNYRLEIPKIKAEVRLRSDEVFSQNQLAELKKKHIVTQLHTALDKYFVEWQFISPRSLGIRFPFNNNGKGYVHYDLHRFYISNEELFEFLSKVEINRSKIKIPSELLTGFETENLEVKLEESLERLTRNLIYKISTQRSNFVDIIYVRDNAGCDCVRCLYNRFEFSSLSEALKVYDSTKSSTLEDLKIGYVHFKLGNFKTAQRIYKDVVDKSLAKGILGVHYYIAIFNLSKLIPFFKNMLGYGQNVFELIEESNKVDLETEITNVRISKTEDAALIINLLSTDFFYEGYMRIDASLAKIREHYYSQIRGGWSSNSHIEHLVNDYEELALYIKENFILYEHFSEFETFTNKLVEGVFLSYSIDDQYGGSSLETLNDYLLVQMLLHSDKDFLLKQYNKSTITKFRYQKSENKFGTIVEKILSDYVGNGEYVESLLESENVYFQDRRNELLHKVLILTSILELDRVTVLKLVREVIKGLKLGKFKHFDQKYILFFLSKNAEVIGVKNFQTILKNASKINNGNIEEFVERICMALEQAFPNFRIDDSVIAKIVMYGRGQTDERLLVTNYKLLNPRLKREYKKLILDSLSNTYSDDLYYMAVIFGIIPSDHYFKKFKQNCLSSIGEGHVRGPWFESVVTHPKVNKLLNLVLKERIKLSAKDISLIRSISKYYDWLACPDQYNYEQFDPQWVGQYSTLYFVRQLKSIPQVKSALKHYLLKNKNEKLCRIFLVNYC